MSRGFVARGGMARSCLRRRPVTSEIPSAPAANLFCLRQSAFLHSLLEAHGVVRAGMNSGCDGAVLGLKFADRS